MKFCMRICAHLFAALIVFALPVAASLAAMLLPSAVHAQTLSSIEVVGNRRVEIETIRSYFPPGRGGPRSVPAIDEGLKALIETGLCQDVRISRAGPKIIVTVVENP